MKKGIQRIFLVALCATIITAVISAQDAVSAATGCNYYASPTGNGNGLSQSSPFKIANFWAVAKPGSVLCLLDGTYTGASSMIVPPSGLSGTALNPITVKALNDGSVTLNGQAARRPVYLSNNSWFILEGFNAHSGIEEVVLLGTGSSNNIVRRVIAWDAANANPAIFQTHDNTNNLFEDVAGFGIGRYIFSDSQNTDKSTWRRAWGQWSYNTYVGPKNVFGFAYNSYGGTYENLIGTWDQTAMGGQSANQPFGIFSFLGFNEPFPPPNGYCINGKFLGSIGYVRSSDVVPTWWAGLYGSRTVDCVEFNNVAMYIEPGTHTNLTPIYGSIFDGGSGANATAIGGRRKITYTTEIGGTASGISTDPQNGWTITKRVDVDTVAAAPNIWNGAGSNGARVCYRYVNGVLTSTKLWPWPMDARIRAALTASGRNPDAIFGGVGNGVTQQMEAIFGPIPAECKTGATSVSSSTTGTSTISAPSAPSNLQATP